jgi:hypothetical protein
VVNPSDDSFAEGDAPGVINDIALACLTGATTNISSTTAAKLRPRTRPRLEGTILVMVESPRTQATTGVEPFPNGPLPTHEFAFANERSR